MGFILQCAGGWLLVGHGFCSWSAFAAVGLWRRRNACSHSFFASIGMLCQTCCKSALPFFAASASSMSHSAAVLLSAAPVAGGWWSGWATGAAASVAGLSELRGGT